MDMLNKSMKYFLMTFFCATLLLGDISCIFANDNVVSTQRDALLETADAYYRQGEQLQYDSYRKNLLSTPEDATSQHYAYTVCSGFTFQVYYQTLGIEIPDTTEELLDYAKANLSYKNNVLVYYSGVDTIYGDNVLGNLDKANYSNLVKEWAEFLLPGDIIVVSGHSMMVYSVDSDSGKVIIVESASGDRYDYINHVEMYDKNGTIKYTDLDYRLKTYYNRLKTGKNLIEEISVIRVITDGKSYINSKNKIDTYNGLTSSAKSRLKFNKIDIEKTLTIKDEKQTLLADLSDDITYKIVIKNSSDKDYGSFSVVENIDSRVQLVDKGDGLVDGSKLKWNISSLKAGSSVTLTYTIKIPNDKDLFGKTIVSSGLVDNIATSKIEILIGHKLEMVDVKKINNSFDKLKNGSFYEREFINEIYKDALGVDLGITGKRNLDIISFDSNIKYGKDSLSIKGTRVNDTNVAKYIFSNFYGLRIGASNNESDSVVRSILQWNLYPSYENYDRSRTIESDMLIDGDIILGYLGDTSSTDTKLVDKSYLYLNNKLIRKKADNSFEEIDGDKLTVFLRDLVGENYIILRPSISLLSIDDDIPLGDTGNNNESDNNNNNNNEDVPVEDNNGNVLENPKTGQILISFIIMFILSISMLYIYNYGLCNIKMKK